MFFDCSIALYPIASQPNSRITSAARICVASSFSLNMSQNLERMPSGGPPSIMLRSSSGRPIDINCAREGGLDKATYIHIRFDLRRQRKHAKKKISRHPDLRNVGCPSSRIWRYPVGRKSGYLGVRKSGCLEIRISGWPEIRVAGYPDSRVLRHPDSRISGSPDICKSSPLNFVHFHLCAIYLNFSLEFRPAADICREPSQLR